MNDPHATAVEVTLNLQVILAPDGDQWVAQAIQIDYAASGNDIEDVKRRFEKGLTDTITEHLRQFGSLDNLIQEAPAAQWRDLVKPGRLHLYTQVSLHTVSPSVFPFSQIDFYKLEAVA